MDRRAGSLLLDRVCSIQDGSTPSFISMIFGGGGAIAVAKARHRASSRKWALMRLARDARSGRTPSTIVSSNLGGAVQDTVVLYIVKLLRMGRACCCNWRSSMVVPSKTQSSCIVGSSKSPNNDDRDVLMAEEDWMQGPRPKYGDNVSLIPGGRAFIVVSRPYLYASYLCVAWKSMLLGRTSDRTCFWVVWCMFGANSCGAIRNFCIVVL
jgi:hypothetical protein